MKKHFPIFLCVLGVLGLSACATTSNNQPTWPEVDALPTQAPSDLDVARPAPMLAQGTDGFLWVVGALPDDATAGRSFSARYAGDWPLNMPRPALAVGHVAKRVTKNAAVVSLDYFMPDSTLEGLEVTWDAQAEVGKGVSVVAEAADDLVRFPIDTNAGVKSGDVYGVFAPATAKEIQLSRRLRGVCVVTLVGEAQTSCQMWPGPSVLEAPKPAPGDSVIFLEHTFGVAPRQAHIAVLEVIDGDPQIQAKLVKALSSFVNSVPSAKVDVVRLAKSSDPRRADFYHSAELVDYDGNPTIIVGASVAIVDGAKHLFVNYTGVGPVSGPGMVAAPPDQGIDLGRVERVSDDQLRSVAGVVFAAVQVYRGQTSEALVTLERLLSSTALRGPLRWHARDQFAMRWLGLGHFHEALWLVEQDMAVANERKDRDAYLNALGTAIRLYDQRNLKDRALNLSNEYLQARTPEKPGVAYRAAVGMHVEMLLGLDRIDEARTRISELETLCPDGCGGDLVSMLSAAFWATPQTATDFQDELLGKITRLSEAQGGESLAALRVYQGLRALAQGNLEEAVIGFLEAERLYEALSYSSGVARAKYFRMMAEMARKEPNAALEAGAGAIEIQRSLQDFADVSVVYERLATLYTSFDPAQQPGPYLSAAGEVLAENVQSALAVGNLGKASESLFAMAAFLMRLGQLDEAKTLLRRAVVYSIDAARFDMTALSHLSLAHIAREQGDFEEFKDEISNARLMAEISKNPDILEAIERSLTPPEPQPEDPTRLL